MTKAELITAIAIETGYDKTSIARIVESMMDNVKKSVAEGENVYLRGFGSFISKIRAQKVARDISRKMTIDVPAHRIPAFKASVEFANQVKTTEPVQEQEED